MLFHIFKTHVPNLYQDIQKNKAEVHDKLCHFPYQTHKKSDVNIKLMANNGCKKCHCTIYKDMCNEALTELIPYILKFKFNGCDRTIY